MMGSPRGTIRKLSSASGLRFPRAIEAETPQPIAQRWRGAWGSEIEEEEEQTNEPSWELVPH
jgi:hypothetical protein